MIEVADFKSNFSDVAGTEEEKGKGNAPKETMNTVACFLGMHLRSV